ncbi:MAG TPA: AlkA N-terminal domain-containing protein [Thermoleophilaceae bacterium]|nr:AlkA N-terminal domain-containing protein [Thermoleophilaceae bacterium]
MGFVIDDFERCYRFMQSRDPRYDGFFVVAVTSTGVYCRSSCPARLPSRRNVRLFRSAAAAQEEGFRACKRCDPDGAPGSPAWNRRADVAGRALRLIADGAVDREGVGGLAARLHFSERQLNRILVTEVGAGPVALARAQRAQSARTLIEGTGLPLAQVALGAGFGSVRQFNDTVRAVYARTPTELRRRAHRRRRAAAPGAIELRLPCREPFDGHSLVAFLAARAVPGVEEVTADTYRRSLSLERAAAVVSLTPTAGAVRCELRLDDLRDLTAAVARCRRLLDLDADPLSISSRLEQGDGPLAPLVRRRPGLRVPGCVDGFELGVRAIVGQQVSVPAARTILGRLVAAYGEPLPEPDGALTHRFPSPAALAELDLAALPFPRTRAQALRSLARLVADGDLSLGPGADSSDTLAALQGIPGIGPWTASYVAMRALGDPDVFLPGDVGIRHALERLGGPISDEEWRPWRSYAVVHLWRSLHA